MNLIDYIKSDKRGKRANAVERKAHEDPFVADALEGYESIYDNHFDYLKELEQYVELRARGKRRNKKRRAVLWSVGSAVAAAAAAICIVSLNPQLVRNIDRGVPDLFIAGTEQPALAEAIAAGSPEAESSEVMLALYYDGTRHKITVPGHAYILNGEVVIMGDAAPSGDPAHPGERLSDAIAEIYIPVSPDNTLYTALIDVDSADAEESDMSSGALLAMAENTASQPLRRKEVANADRGESRGQALEPIKESVSVEDAVADMESVSEPVIHEQAEAVQSRGTDTLAADTSGQDGIVYVQNSKFERYFNSMRTVYTDESGNSLSGKEVVAEFRVNSRGTPSGIRIISSPSKNISKEVVNILSAYSVWEPSNTRIRTRIKL